MTLTISYTSTKFCEMFRLFTSVRDGQLARFELMLSLVAHAKMQTIQNG